MWTLTLLLHVVPKDKKESCQLKEALKGQTNWC